jgi:spermidine synthase
MSAGDLPVASTMSLFSEQAYVRRRREVGRLLIFAFMYYLFAVGFVSILGQVVILRELNVAFYGVELIYTLALGVWLLFGAFGAMISRRIQAPSYIRINVFFLLLSITIPLDVAFIRSVRLIFFNIPGAYLPLQKQIAAISISLLPLAFLLGLLFQWTAKAYVAKQRSLAAAYAIESLGGLAGGICATLFLKLGLQNFFIALLCALFAACPSFLNVRRRGTRWLPRFSVMISVVLIALLWKAPMFDRLMTSWTHPNLVETRDSPYSRITVTLLNGQVSVFENDALLFDTEGTQAEEFVHLAALQHPHPDRVLILGGGIEGTVREVLLHSPRIVDYVELNPTLLDIVPRNLPYEIQKSLESKNVHIIVEDPRKFLNQAPSYDLILVGMPEPTSGQANRFYTEEFFRQCYAKLNGRGLVAFRLQSSENMWTKQLTRRMVSIYRAAKSVFPEVMFIPGSTNVVIGSRNRLTRDDSILASRLEARKIKAKLISPSYLRYVFNNDRFDEVAQILKNGTAPINTDVHPICYQYTTMIWLSKFLPGTNLWDFPFPESRTGRSLLWLIALSLPTLLVCRARWPIRRALLMGMAAFAGMVLETILLLYFQIKNGILYQDIGILLMSFMAGLALGAFAVAGMNRPFSKKPGIAMLLGFLALSAAIGLEISLDWGAGLGQISILLALSGFFVSGIFAYAGFREAGDQKTAIAPLYAADLIGGCVGSVLASLVLAPIAGLVATAYLMVPLVMLSALLL